MSPEQWDAVLATNLKGTFLAVKACVPYLRKSAAGRILITSSLTGPITGFPGWTHYGASKSGQLGFLLTAAIELAKYGITVNAVMPGNIITEGLESLGPEYHKIMDASIPLKPLGTVEDSVTPRCSSPRRKRLCHWSDDCRGRRPDPSGIARSAEGLRRGPRDRRVRIASGSTLKINLANF